MAASRRVGVEPARRATRARRGAAAFLLLIFVGCAGQGPFAGERHALWRVQGDHNTVYLLGSVHVLPRDAYPLKPALRRALEDSTQVVFEVNLATFNAAAVAREFRHTGFYPPGDRLERHVTAGTKLLLQRALPTIGVGWERVQRLRPWFLAEVLSSRYLDALGFRQDLGVDAYFYRLARARGKAVSGLETLRDQAQILTGFDDRQSEVYLRSTLGGLPAYPSVLRQLVNAWQNGDVALLDRLLNQNARSDPESFRLMFSDRNAKWLPAIEKFAHEDGNVLVVVGSGHLVGNEGVVQTLRRRGYRVRQL